jgi:hypothetical protein
MANKFFNILAILFYFAVTTSLAIFIIESFTYSGFLLKHINIDVYIFQYLTIIFGIFALLFKSNINLAKYQFLILKKIFLINLIICITLITFEILINVLDSLIMYPNFVFSIIHLQPKLFGNVVFVSLISLVVNTFFIFRVGETKLNSLINKIKNRFKSVRIYLFKWFHIIIPRFSFRQFRYFVLIIYTFSFVGYLVYSSVDFVKKFYKVDLLYRQQNELKYFSGEINIYDWIKEFLPKTSDVILWCDRQTSPIKLVTFDPEIIWMSYDALSRVFLTNCYYANIDPVSKSYDYFDKDELLLVSVSKCDPYIVDTHPDPKLKIIEYFKIINNEYICKSDEIVPGLYLYKK